MYSSMKQKLFFAKISQEKISYLKKTINAKNLVHFAEKKFKLMSWLQTSNIVKSPHCRDAALIGIAKYIVSSI